MVSGAATIRAYRKQEHLFGEFLQKNELLNACNVHERLAIPWLRVRIEYSILLLVVLSIVFTTISKEY